MDSDFFSPTNFVNFYNQKLESFGLYSRVSKKIPSFLGEKTCFPIRNFGKGKSIKKNKTLVINLQEL
jgi:hypothetical protein